MYFTILKVPADWQDSGTTVVPCTALGCIALADKQCDHQT